MAFSRFNEARKRSGSSPMPPVSVTPRTFLPSSHYAAVAGVDYQQKSSAATDASSASSISSGSQGTSKMYPTQTLSDFSSPSDSDSGLMSRLARRTSFKSSNSGSSSSKSDRQLLKKKRESQLGELALVETQLLPTLRDTIDRMTHPTSPTAEAPSFDSHISHEIPPSYVANTSHFRLQESSTTAYKTSTTPTLHSAPKPILKSSLRTPTVPSVSATFSPPTKSLRSVKSMTNTPRLNTPNSNLNSPPTPRTAAAIASRKPSSFLSSTSRAYSSNPSTPNTSSAPSSKRTLSQPTSRIPTATTAPRSSRFAYHELNGSTGLGQFMDSDRTPRGLSSPLVGEQPPWTSSPMTAEAARMNRSGIGLGLGLNLNKNQSSLLVEEEPDAMHEGLVEDGDYDEGRYADFASIRRPRPRYADPDEEERMRRRRRETLLAIVDGIQVEFGDGLEIARESSEYNGFEGWAIGSANSSLIEGERRRNSAIRVDKDDLSVYSGDEGRSPRTSNDSKQGPRNLDLKTRLANACRNDRSQRERDQDSTRQLPRVLDQLRRNSKRTDPESSSRLRRSFPYSDDRHSVSATADLRGISSTPASPRRHGTTPELPVPAPKQLNGKKRRSMSTPAPAPPKTADGAPESQRSTRTSWADRCSRSSLEDEGRIKSVNWPTFNVDRGRSKLRPVSRNDRDHFGIPSSLSYDFGPGIRESGIPPAESDNSLAERDGRWREMGEEESRSLLSVGAEKLFQSLADDDMDEGYAMAENIHIEPPSQDEHSPYNQPRFSHLRDSQFGCEYTNSESTPSIYDDAHQQTWTVRRESEQEPRTSGSLSRTWKSTISPLTYQSLAQRYGDTEMQRQEVIWELCESEVNFVKRLRTIIRLFVKPLRMQDTACWIEGVPGNVTRLFDWLEDIMNLHVEICSAMRVMLDRQRPVVERAAEVIRAFVTRLEVYQPYVVRVDDVLGQIVADGRVGEHVEQRSDFGEFVRIQEQDEDCEGWTLEMLLLEPLNRLATYSAMFKTLCDRTPKDHIDHIATFSLIHSTEMIIRVLHEVKVREDEYNMIKDIASSVDGLLPSSTFARRERRLLVRGPLYRTLPVGNLPAQSTGSQVDSKEPARRSVALLNAISDWDPRRYDRTTSRAASSPDSYYRHTPEAREPHSHSTNSDGARFASSFEGELSTFNKQTSLSRNLLSKQSLVDVFVFTDLILLAIPLHKRHGRGFTNVNERWKLVEEIGSARVLRVSEHREVIQGQEENIIMLDVIPVDLQGLDKGITLETARVVTVHLTLPGYSAKGTHDDKVIASRYAQWIAAFNQCYQFTLRSLSFPSHSGNNLAHGPNVDFEADTRETVLGILNSGLPLPKSPSIQVEEVKSGKKKHLVDMEREERGWWTVRFRQVFKEIQRQDVSLFSSLPNSGMESVFSKRPVKLGSETSMESISDSAKEIVGGWAR